MNSKIYILKVYAKEQNRGPKQIQYKVLRFREYIRVIFSLVQSIDVIWPITRFQSWSVILPDLVYFSFEIYSIAIFLRNESIVYNQFVLFQSCHVNI